MQKELLNYVQTIQDVVDLHRMTAAEFSVVPNGQKCAHDIIVSAAEVKKALNPMLFASRKYLLEQDITEEELGQIMAETGASGDDMILVAMTLSASEFKQVEQQTARNNTPAFNLFASPCYAAPKGSDLGLAFDCAVQALGVDIMFSFRKSMGTKWAKAALKKVFKTVAGTCWRSYSCDRFWLMYV
ncbi:MAG: hypothetical protein K6A82_06310 [Prevotella sp.]|nr:hypothetical protein [Prevotella sp.]